MGRVKREIKRIDSNKNRQVTFTKRKNGLVKKVYELSVLCDVDIGLIAFSPAGQLTHFSGKTRIEDLFDRYLNLSDEERGSYCSRPESTEYLTNMLKQIRTQNEEALRAENNGAMERKIEELLQEHRRLQKQLETAEEQLRNCEPDLSNMTSLDEIESCEKQLEHKLSCITKRKEYLLNSHASTSYSASASTSYSVSSIQEMQQQMTSAFENYGRGMPDNNHNHAQMNHPSLTCVPSREFTPSMPDSVLHAKNSNFNPQIIEEGRIGPPDNENLVPCPHDYVPSDPNAFDMPRPLLLPPIQNWIEEQLEMPCDSAILHTTTRSLDQQIPSMQLNADSNMLNAYSGFLVEQLRGDEIE